jgi:hypothetical protein
VAWFVQRPTLSADRNPGTPVILHAYNAANLGQSIFSVLTGTWTHAVNSNANLVPTVAKGHVYVASNLQLKIYGLKGAGSLELKDSTLLTASKPDVVTCPATLPAATMLRDKPLHELYGTVCRADGQQIMLALRNGHAVAVDVGAFDQHRPVLLTPGRALHVTATLDKTGVLHARMISPSHTISPETPPDR